MRYRSLGASELNVSEVGLGAMNFGWRTPTQEASQILQLALSKGINFIDTSNSYGKGVSEQIVGEALRSLKARERIVLATKFRITPDEADDNPDRIGQAILRQCEESLARLQTDRIDLYQLHFPKFPIDAILRSLERLVRDGKIRYAGACNFDGHQVDQSAGTASQQKLLPFISAQAPYNLLDRSIEKDLVLVAQARQVGLVTYFPLAEGILTGKYRRGKELPPISRYALVTKPGLYSARLTSDVFDKLEKFEALAARKKVPLTVLSLAWCLHAKDVSSVLIGPASCAQLSEDLEALSTSLTPSDLSVIDQIVKPGSTVSSFKPIF